MSCRILAVQQEHAWVLHADGRRPGACDGARFLVALTGFISNLDALEKRCAVPPDPALTPAGRLVRLLEKAGCELLVQLQGSFSVLVIRPETGQLWARRDRLGAHSLYLARQTADTGWVVGNSAADVLRASAQRFEEDPEYLAAFFSLSSQTPEHRSAFRAVQAVLPGQMIEIDGATVRRTRPPVDIHQPPKLSDEQEAIECFRALLERSIADCLAPDSDTAVMLSGGMDSGPVAVLGDRLCTRHGRHLIPISWTLRDYPQADESRWVDQLAQGLSSPLVGLESSDALPFAAIESADVNPESPSFNAFRPLVNRCYRAAVEHGCTVILNGNAGDELYPDYALLYRGYLAQREWRYLFQDLSQTLRHGRLRAVWRKPPLRALGVALLGLKKSRPIPAWLTDYAGKHHPNLATWPPECIEHPVPEYAEQLYGRRMASGRAIEYFQAEQFGVERRDPFQNEDLVAFMLNAPFSFSFRNQRTKWIMREAMKGLMPEGLRLKRRTGLLTSFYNAGKIAHREAIASFLFKRQREWQRWIEPDALRRILEQRPESSGSSTIVIDRCIGYVNWLRYWQGG